jgi:ABC-type multidrug transport system fused ATPase/permease subunit
VLRTRGDAGAIIGAMALIGQLAMPFAQLVAFPNIVLQYRPNLRALARILALPDPGDPPDAAIQLAKGGQAPALAVRDLVFRYPGASADILQGISMDIPAAARVGIVGGSGCGKSTLARILSGDYRAVSGTMTIAGVDVTGWPLTWKRELIAFITDAPGFLMDTLRANILFGRRCSPEQFDLALEKSGVKGFLHKNPLDQPLAAEVTLAGGERRKIALARALCGPQGVLILDEPLAQVDPNGMREMARHIIEATKGRTTIIITHDMDVMETDFNIFLLDGKVAAVGKHADLVRTVPAYAELASRTAEDRG